jgi:putative ABC transport system permease protein
VSAGFLAVTRALILRPIAHERIRTAVTLAGIAVGVAVIVAIQLASQSSLRAFRESVDAISGRANFQIVSDGGPIDQRLLLRLQPLWREGLRFAPVIDIEGAIEPSQVPIRLLAVDLLSDLHFRDYRYARVSVGGTESAAGWQPTVASIGRFLELFRPDSVILPASLAKQRGLKIGSPLTLSFLGRTRTMIVRGLLETTGPAAAFNGSIAIADVGAAQKAFGLDGRLTRVDLMVPDERSDAILTALRAALPVEARLERPSRRNDRVDKMLRAFRVNLFALAGVALLVGMFLVYNTVLISILRRRKDIGILKTIGVSARQIFFAFLLEGALFGLLGSALGLALGYGLAVVILGLIGRTINELYVATAPSSVTMTPLIASTGVLVGTLFSLISGILPSLEAASVRPDLLIRTGLQQRFARSSMASLAAWAGVAMVLAAVASLLPPVGGIAVAGYIAVLFVVISFSLLSPWFVSTGSRLARPVAARLFGVTGKLAASSLPLSLRRTAVASAALSLATGMMVAVALMVGSFRETVNVWVRQTVASDLWLRPARSLTSGPSIVFPASIAGEVARVDFVAAVDRVRGKEVVYQDSNIAVGGGDFSVIAEHGDLPMIAPRADAALRSAVDRGGVLVSESFSLKFHKPLGDVVELPTAEGARRFPIVGVYRDYSNDRGSVMMDRPLYVRLFRDDTIATLAVYLKPGVSPDAARARLEAEFGPKYHAFAITNASIRREVMAIFDQTFMITYALLAVAIIVAVLGIVNTLAALILERRHEIALLRVLGMTHREIRVMILLESFVLGTVSIAVGIVNGYVLSYILIYVINKQSFGWTIAFHTPVALICASVATTLVASVMAGLLPARLANRMALAPGLKRE